MGETEKKVKITDYFQSIFLHAFPNILKKNPLEEERYNEKLSPPYIAKQTKKNPK